MPTSAVGSALRVAVATTLCVVVAEWAQLDFAFMSAMTAHRVMAQSGFTAFQKGLERVLGRILGVVYGLALLALFADSAAALAGMVLGMLVFFYGSLSGRWAYTFLNAGLLLAGIMAIGHEDYSAAVPAAWNLILEVALGVFMADLVNWLSGAERDLAIQTAGPPLWPIQGPWLSHSAMLVVAVLVTQALLPFLELSANQTLISVMILGVSADEQALVRKGWDRLAGTLLGGLWGFGSFLLLARVPHFGLLLALAAGPGLSWEFPGRPPGLRQPDPTLYRHADGHGHPDGAPGPPRRVRGRVHCVPSHHWDRDCTGGAGGRQRVVAGVSTTGCHRVGRRVSVAEHKN